MESFDGPRFRYFFDLFEEIKRANAAYLASQGITIPASIRKPTSGPCAECGHDTDERDDGEWCHESCAEDSRKARRQDERLDDPRHTPYGGRR